MAGVRGTALRGLHSQRVARKATQGAQREAAVERKRREREGASTGCAAAPLVVIVKCRHWPYDRQVGRISPEVSSPAV